MNLQRNRNDLTSSWDWRAAVSAGRLAQDAGDLRRAEVRFREAVNLAQTSGSRDGLQEALNALGVCLAGQGRLEEAAHLFREVMADAGGQPAQSKAFNASRNNLAEVLSRLGHADEAAALLRTSLTEGEAPPAERAAALNNLAVILADKEQYGEAEGLLRESLESTRSILGDRHPQTIGLLANLGVLLRKAGKEGEGIAVLEQALKTSETVLGPEHTQTTALRTELGGA